MAILLLGACGGSAGTPPLEQASQPQYLETTAVLEQLNSSALPDGVDAAVYDELRSALQAALAAGPDRITLDDPPPLAARVQDLQLRPFGDDRELSWSLVLPGDYDQNGEVGISDLAPLGRFYGSKAEQDFPSALAGGPLGSPFPYDLAESVVDGDGNGQIGLPDVSVIAQNFGRSLDSYLIFGSSDPFDYPAYAKNREIAAQGIVNLAQATGIPSRERRHFSLRLTDYDDAFSYWVRPALKGSPGAVSNAVGLSLPAHTGTLQMLSVSPLAAKPGEQLRLSFNQDLPADSSIISLRFGGPLQIPATDCFVSGNELRTVMPPLSAGTIELEVWQTGFSIGKASLTVKEAQTTLSQLHYDLSLDDSRDAMLAALENYLDDNQENAAAELTTYKGYLIQLSKLCQQRSQFADEAQQRRFLCYLENSGLMELLDMLATPDRGVSRAEESHFERMKLDAWSASLRTAQRSLSRPALAAAVLEDGSTMSPMLPLQIYLESLASCIDCFMPTDLNSLRMNSSVHGLRSGETGNGFRVEGLFSSQSAVTEGAYDRLQDRSLAMLPIGVDYPGDAAAELRAQLSVSALNYYAGKPFMETSLHTVSLAGDPWEGHVGNYVETLDMQLYRLDSAWQLEDTVLSGLFRDWQELQPFGGNLSASIVSVRGDAGLVDASQTYDKLILHEPGRQTMDLRAWRIDSGGTALFWQPQAIVPVTLTTPLWVDRYGDWANTAVAEINDLGGGGPLQDRIYSLPTDPPLLLHGHWRYESGYIDSIRIARLGAGGEWTDVLVKDAAHLLGAALLDGNPLIMYESDGTSYFQRSVDAGGTDWSSQPLALPYPALDGQLAVSSGIPGYLGDFEYAGQSGYHYVAASDGALSGWEEPVFLMDAPVDNLLLRVVGGLPAIAWQESDSDSIYYRTAADAGGSSWAAGNTIVSGYELRQLADVNGLPAVVYAHSALVYITPFPGSAPGSFYGENVYYIAAADHAGTGWGAAVKLGTAVVSIYTSFEGSETSRVSIMELAGRPAVAWSGDSLFLSQALDASGQSWAEAQALQAPICYLVNLLEHNSKPLVLSASVRSMIANGAAANMIYSSVPDLEPWQP